MRSRTVLTALALLLVGVLPAFAAAPFGSLDGKAGGGNAASGLMPGTGWALATNGVASVDIFVDGNPFVRALYGKRRPTVTRRYPGYPDSKMPGFEYALDTTQYLNGIHAITAVITSKTGEQTTLGPVNIQFLNASHMLKPFGLLIFPNSDAELRGRCNTADPTRRWSVFSGVAFDAGVEEGYDIGVRYVELMVDGSLWANTVVNCYYDGTPTGSGGYTDCFGLASPGWDQLYPSLPDSDRAGFRFVLDVGSLITDSGYRQGGHRITIRAGDIAGNYRNIADIPVFFSCEENFKNEPSFGAIEHPDPSQPYSDTITVDGWALDAEGVASVVVYVNHIAVGTATINLPRPDIAGNYPGYPQTIPPAGAGFTFQLDTTKFNDGASTIEIHVIDVFGVDTLLGEVPVVFSNQVGP